MLKLVGISRNIELDWIKDKIKKIKGTKRESKNRSRLGKGRSGGTFIHSAFLPWSNHKHYSRLGQTESQLNLQVKDPH